MNFVSKFEQQGYIIIPQLFALKEVSEFSLKCDRILAQWFERFPRYKQKPRKRFLVN